MSDVLRKNWEKNLFDGVDFPNYYGDFQGGNDVDFEEIVKQIIGEYIENAELGTQMVHLPECYSGWLDEDDLKTLKSLLQQVGFKVEITIAIDDQILVCVGCYSENFGKFHKYLQQFGLMCLQNHIVPSGRNLYPEVRGSFQSVQTKIHLLNDVNKYKTHKLCGRMTEVGQSFPPYFGNWGSFYEGDAAYNWVKKDGKWETKYGSSYVVSFLNRLTYDSDITIITNTFIELMRDLSSNGNEHENQEAKDTALEWLIKKRTSFVIRELNIKLFLSKFDSSTGRITHRKVSKKVVSKRQQLRALWRNLDVVNALLMSV